MKNNSTCSDIPPLISTTSSGQREFHCTEIEKAECLNDYFVSISRVDDANTELPFLFTKL